MPRNFLWSAWFCFTKLFIFHVVIQHSILSCGWSFIRIHHSYAILDVILVFIRNMMNIAIDLSKLEKLHQSLVEFGIMKTKDIKDYVLFLQKIRMNDILSNILRMQGGVFLYSNYIILSEFWDTFLFNVKNVPIMPI